MSIDTPEELAGMRRVGALVAHTLRELRAAVRPGVTTGELDALAARIFAREGARSGPELTYDFPGTICISVNEEVVHGVPGHRVLAEGDLLSIDCGAVVEGWHGDSAITVAVGEVPPQALALSEATRTALWRGIAAARLGGHVGDISAAVEACVRSYDASYGIVEEYVGHGIGSAMHQPPDVPNQVARGVLAGRNRGPRIVEGLALAVEPMLTLGSPENHVLADDWTVVTDDGQLAAHWEHTMTVTEGGIWVLTAEDGGEEMLAALGAPFGPLAD
jgi:methionyl aminopeptidase